MLLIVVLKYVRVRWNSRGAQILRFVNLLIIRGLKLSRYDRFHARITRELPSV